MKQWNFSIKNILCVLIIIGIVGSLFASLFFMVNPYSGGECSKLDLLTIFISIPILLSACLGVLLFPPGKIWKYWSWGWGLCALILQLCRITILLTQRNYTWEDVSNLYFFWQYPWLVFILWGMFIAYLTTPTRRKYAYAYLVGMALIIYIASQFDGTTNI